ncbi:Arm DNA-binding domain-containing protein [Burkholderia sp. BCC1644]|uniref:Arm DNA-binding domain-containing protein n=1 Tax=Burkholderia sp. BCC1644 TaxID=2676293 RepID=UPI001FC8B042|nr:Arm DNA-binding domain-containing protein [Burkholderia sp. BCC1644]
MSDSEKAQRAGKDALNFTKAAIEALAMPEKGWKYYYDAKVGGLAIGIGPDGVKTLTLYLKANRRKWRIKIGRYPDLTVGKARMQALTLIKNRCCSKLA